MVQIKANDLLAQMQAMAKQAQANKIEANQPFANQNINTDNKTDFSNVLKNSIEKVSEIQKNAGEMATRFEMGDKDVDVAEVMVNLQKANVSFQAMTQVRNRLVSAYQEIMNMQI